MSTLVLNRNSISVNLESDHLLIRDHLPDGSERSLQTLPIKDVDRVLIVGAYGRPRHLEPADIRVF